MFYNPIYLINLKFWKPTNGPFFCFRIKNCYLEYLILMYSYKKYIYCEIVLHYIKLFSINKIVISIKDLILKKGFMIY